MKNALIAKVEAAGLKTNLSDFEIGDQVEVHQKILEGEKERVQIFAGMIIARKGEGMREMFTVRRLVGGEGVERTFPLNSPKIAKIEVKRSGKVRRAKLYYLRDRVGRDATRLRERKKKVAAAPAPEAAASTPAPETPKA